MDKFKLCKCGKKLWQVVDENTIKLTDLSGQDYFIAFNYVEAKCRKCGRDISEKSEVTETITDLFMTTNPYSEITSVHTDSKAYAKLSNYDINLIRKKLNTKVKRDFLDMVIEYNRNNYLKTSGTSYDDFLDGVSKKMDKPIDEAVKLFQEVEEVVKTIKPNFRLYEKSLKYTEVDK